MAEIHVYVNWSRIMANGIYYFFNFSFTASPNTNIQFWRYPSPTSAFWNLLLPVTITSLTFNPLLLLT